MPGVSWLDQAWAEDPRAAAKAAFQYLWFYTRFAGTNHVDDLDDQAQQVLAYLESRRDPATGFIGMGPTWTSAGPCAATAIWASTCSGPWELTSRGLSG